jgi:hypothetical protein
LFHGRRHNGAVSPVSVIFAAMIFGHGLALGDGYLTTIRKRNGGPQAANALPTLR